MFEQGKVTHLIYLHDADCSKLKGGQCTCNPDMELRADFPWDLYPPEKEKARVTGKNNVL